MKKLALALALFSLVTLFAACGPNGNTPGAATEPTASASIQASGTSEPPASEPPDNVRTDLRLAAVADVSTFDPMYTSSGADGTLRDLLYDTLLAKGYAYDADGNTVAVYRPEVAESWTFSDDFLEVTFNLKQGILFHNGEAMKAGDVVFSLDRSAASPYFMAKMEGYLSAEATDDYTVKVTLEKTVGAFIDNMSSIAIVSEKYVTGLGDEAFAEQPMGTGPYTLTEWAPLQGFSLTAFEDYHKGAAPIKTVQIDILPDPTSVMMAFESGSFDMAAIPTENVDRILNSGRWATYQSESVHPYFLMVNFENEYFSDVRIRQALHYAINKADNVALAQDGHGKEALSFFNPELMINTTLPDHVFSYDLVKAGELLAEAGYPGGTGLPEFSIKVIAGLYEKHALVLQQAFDDLGLHVRIEVVEPNSWGQDVTLGNYEMSVNAASVSDLVYPWNILFIEAYMDAANFARLRSPELEALFDDLSTTMDEETQRAIIKDIINYVNDNAIYIPISYTSGITALDPALRFDVHPRDVNPYNLYWVE